MTPEAITARIAVLKDALARAQASNAEARRVVEQSQADCNAISGAIQESEYWLTQIPVDTPAKA